MKQLKKVTQRDRYGNQVTMEYEVGEKALDPTALMSKQMEMMMPEMPEAPPVMGEEFNMGDPNNHPGEPRGQDTVPAWLTPGEFVVNKEATQMFGPQIEAMNEVGRMAQGGQVPTGYHRMPDGTLMAGESHGAQYHAEGGLTSYEDSWLLNDIIKPKMEGLVDRARSEGMQVGHQYEPQSHSAYNLPHSPSQGKWQAASKIKKDPSGGGYYFDTPRMNVPLTPSLANAYVLGEEYAHARGKMDNPELGTSSRNAVLGKLMANKNIAKERVMEEARAKQAAQAFVGGLSPDVTDFHNASLGGYMMANTKNFPKGEHNASINDVVRAMQQGAGDAAAYGFNMGGMALEMDEPQYHNVGNLIRGITGAFPAMMGALGVGQTPNRVNQMTEAPVNPMMAEPPPEVMAEMQAPNLRGFESVEDLLAEREGFRDEIYLDSLGKPTVGYGRLIEDAVWDPNDPRIGTKPYSVEQLEQFKKDDIKTAAAAAKRNLGAEHWDKLTPEQQWALTSQAFQLGETGQSKFKKQLQAIRDNDFEEAARQAYDSKWYKQTPKRTHDLAYAFAPNIAAQYKNDGGFMDYETELWARRNDPTSIFGSQVGPAPGLAIPEVPTGAMGEPVYDPAIHGLQQPMGRPDYDDYGNYIGAAPPSIPGIGQAQAAAPEAPAAPPVPTDVTLSPGKRDQGLPSALAMEQAREERDEMREAEWQRTRERIASELPPIHNMTQQDLDDLTDKVMADEEAAWQQQVADMEENKAPPLPEDQQPQTKAPETPKEVSGVLAAIKKQQQEAAVSGEITDEQREAGGLPSNELTQQAINRGIQEAEENPEGFKEVMNNIKDNFGAELTKQFGETFSAENLANLAIKSMGAMAFGTPPMQALQFAVNDTLQIQAKRKEQEAAQAKTLQQQAATLAGNKAATPASIEAFKRSGGDFSKLEAPAGKASLKTKITGNDAFIPGQGRVNIYDVDGTSMYYDNNNKLVPVANNPDAQVFDSTTMSNKAVKQDFDDQIKSYVNTMNEGLEEKDAFRVDNERIAAQANRIFQEDLKGANLPVESAEELKYQIGESTREYVDALKKYRDATKEDPDQTDVVKPTSLEAFHQNRMVTLKAGILPSELAGSEAKQMRQINKRLADEAPGNPQHTVNVWKTAHAAWQRMTPEEKEFFDPKGGILDRNIPGYSPFTYFVHRLVDDDPKAADYVKRIQ